jgi:hypothetical protein
VVDIVMMENYLHREGKKPGPPGVLSIAPKAKISVGRVDQGTGTVEILVKSAEEIGGFQFRLTGTDSILRVLTQDSRAQDFTFKIHETAVVAMQSRAKSILPGEGLLIALEIADLKLSELCLEDIVIASPVGDDLRIGNGKCADELFTKEGYKQLKDFATISSKPIRNYDVNQDKTLDVRDVQRVQNILYRRGEQPKYKKAAGQKLRIKLSFGEINKEKKTVEVLMQNAIPIAAFQYELTGIGDLTYNGGAIDSTGTEVVTYGNKVLGYSSDRSIIPPGKWVLTELNYSNAISLETCIREPLFVDVAGNQIHGFVRGCYELTKKVYGCTDKLALNYNPKANTDDGSCAFPKGVKTKYAKRTWWEKLKRRFRARKYKF